MSTASVVIIGCMNNMDTMYIVKWIKESRGVHMYAVVVSHLLRTLATINMKYALVIKHLCAYKVMHIEISSCRRYAI